VRILSTPAPTHSDPRLVYDTTLQQSTKHNSRPVNFTPFHVLRKMLQCRYIKGSRRQFQLLISAGAIAGLKSFK
jgi:hypothetical protein